VLAQEAAETDPAIVTAYRESYVYAGPGETYSINGLLHPGVEITIIERNSIGNWVHIVRANREGEIVIDGWVMTGYLNLNENLHFSDVPINTDLTDADLENVNSQSMSGLYAVPIIPIISDAMREVYELGQTLGIDRYAVTKVGDSLSAGNGYLTVMSNPEYDLGPYDYLEDTLLYFRDSLANLSAAARIGLSTYVVFDPFWADPDMCEAGESPLQCEYRRRRPVVAMIMFGPNDVRAMDAEAYETQMRLIIEATLAEGIIPVISTFSADPEEEFWWQSLSFNLILVELASEYQIPLINLWSAARALPNYGLDRDRIHMLVDGFDHLIYSTGHESWYGVSLQNLLALRTLEEIRNTLGMDD
jgi:hypothetical protein